MKQKDMPGKESNFFKELKRRKVYRVATVYAITGWIIMQVAAVTFPHLNLPGWLISAVIVLVLIGFPIAMVLAWAFEMSPEGFVRTSSPEAENNPMPAHKRKPFTGTISIVILVVLLIGQFIYFKVTGNSKGDISTVEASLLPQKSIAVLPFKNLSKEEDNEYFSDGVMEAILNNLSRIEDLKVISRTSVEPYRNNTDKKIPEIAAELEVANVLEGSVQRMGNNVRIVVQLISAAKDEHIWATNYDRDISDIFVVQSEIAKTIAENLKVILTSNERKIIENAPTDNLVAYDLYLQASELGIHTQKDYERAIDLLKQAIDLDPTFSLPYSLLGTRLYNLERYHVSKTIWFDSALVMLNKSIQLNPANANAYLCKSRIYEKASNAVMVKENLLTALQYDPNNFDILRELGNFYMNAQDYERGINLLLKSLSINKLNESNTSYYKDLAKVFINIDWKLSRKYFQEAINREPDSYFTNMYLAYYLLGEQKYEEALELSKKLEFIRPDLDWSYNNLAYCYMMLKQYDIAEANFIKAKQLKKQADTDRDVPQIALFHGYVKKELGKTEEGQAILDSYKKLYKTKIEKDSVFNNDYFVSLGSIFAYENNKQKAYYYLEKVSSNETDGSSYSLWWDLNTNPLLDNLRGDDRFKKIIQSLLDKEEEKRQLVHKILAVYHGRNELKWLKLE